MNYVRYGDFLVKEAGFEDDLNKIDPCRIYYGNIQNIVGCPFIQFGNLEFAERLKAYRLLLLEGREAYFKAIATGTTPDAYTCARVKINYAIISTLVRVQHIKGVVIFDPTGDVPADPATSGHYAREAEKDLRNYLRRYPDDVTSLQKLGLAIALHRGSDKARGGLISISARIGEANVRTELRTKPPPGLRPPGATGSPYPEDWTDIAAVVRKRDGYQCTECSATDVELHVHHIVPLSHCGSNQPDNLVTLCDYCHK